MKTVLVGVGQAGGKIATALTAFDANMGFGSVLDAVAINTAKTDLSSLPLDSLLIGQDRVGGHGVGGDNELGAAVMQSDIHEVMGLLDGRITARAESIVVIAGLGGGTGSGGAPALVSRLQEVYDVPIYALGVLPGRDEGTIYQVNAGRSLKTLAREADALLLVDNDAWKSSGESLSEGFDAINDSIARRFGLLFAAGEAVEGVGESVVDTSEVINTLRTGGIAALGFASTPAAADPAENITVVMSAARNALLTGCSLPGTADAEAALLVIAGQPDRISRKGVEKARRWLEDETGSMQVRGGDFPIDSDRIAALILLGGVERSKRVDRFLARARQAIKEQAEEPAVDHRDVFHNDELENLF
ncbi:MAG: tubulin/FtsZ family protein [Halobacteriota archaeon]